MMLLPARNRATGPVRQLSRRNDETMKRLTMTMLLLAMALAAAARRRRAGTFGYQFQTATSGLAAGVGPQVTIENDRGQTRLGLCGAGFVGPRSQSFGVVTAHLFTNVTCFKTDI